MKQYIKMIENKDFQKYNKLDLTYDANHRFYKILILKNMITFPISQSIIFSSIFFNDLDKFNKLKPKKKKQKR